MPTAERSPTPPPIDSGIVAFVVMRAKERILADRRSGVIPRAVRSFEALHRYADANTYLLSPSGSFDTALRTFAEKHGPAHAPPLECQEVINAHLNAAMEALNAWLKNGGLARPVGRCKLEGRGLRSKRRRA